VGNSANVDKVFKLPKRIESWLVLDLDAHVEACLRDWTSCLSHVNTYFH
jgi:hypothetical protein